MCFFVLLSRVVHLFAFGLFGFHLLEHRPEDLESSEEFFDLESLSYSSEDFFPAVAQLSDEEFLTAFSTQSEDHITPPEAALALPQESPPIEVKYFPWWTIITAAVNIGMFIIIMGVNNCPKHTIPTKACFPAVFGRFAL
ncbi:hypothetical protein TSUD_72030 [Trifolium subterraneum]|uniref:Rhomboid-like protein n=1 Tax=Trifolium subterraneum TaxID=3900 RepID=A0A2Z6N333_TRISU|nr:hypothetical protein TSUD_72030 [Trifolium subterraneum]